MHCVTYALKKFTGGLGDDDDRDTGDEQAWRNYFIQPLEDASHVVCLQKANGEAAHLSAICVQGEEYLVAGSKNVHLLFQTREQIALYHEDRFQIAREVAECVVDHLDRQPDTSAALKCFLCTEKVTAVFEQLSPAHQHVEDLSYLQRPVLRFIMWTSNRLDADAVSLCHTAPDEALLKARSLGLDTVEFSRIAPAEVESRTRQVRGGYRYEGEVLYFVNTKGEVIGLLKKKTVWYVVVRAIREKLRNALRARHKNAAEFRVSKSHKQIASRLREIQQWLSLDDLAVAKWTDLGCTFVSWVLEVSDPAQHEHVLATFPVYWTRFLVEHPEKTDKIDVTWDES